MKTGKCVKEAGNFALPDMIPNRVRCRVNLLAAKEENKENCLTRPDTRSGEESGKCYCKEMEETKICTYLTRYLIRCDVG